MVVLFAVVIGTMLYTLRTMNAVVSVSSVKTAPKLELFGVISTAKSDMCVAQRGVVLYTIVRNTERVQSAKQEFRQSKDKLEDALNRVRPLLLTAEGKRLCVPIGSGVAAWAPHFYEMERLSSTGQTEEAVSVGLSKTLPIYTEISAAVDRMNPVANGSRCLRKREFGAVASPHLGNFKSRAFDQLVAKTTVQTR